MCVVSWEVVGGIGWDVLSQDVAGVDSVDVGSDFVPVSFSRVSRCMSNGGLVCSYVLTADHTCSYKSYILADSAMDGFHHTAQTLVRVCCYRRFGGRRSR